jgi:hypothetical protein
MNRVRVYVLVSIALAVAVLVPWLGTHAQTQANPKVEFIHTGDWQSGDKVSFTIRGVVVDNPAPENNQQQPTQAESAAGATLRGYVVDMEDPKGNKTEIPWTPLIEYSVPSVEGPITATLIGPGGARVGTAQIPVYKTGTSIPRLLPTQSSETLVAPPISQIGQTYQVYSPAGTLNGQGDATLIAGGSPGSAVIESKALAESPHSAVFEPTGLKPGPTTFTVKEGPALEASFTVSVIAIGLDTSRLQTRGQTGTLVLQVTGFPTDTDALRKLMASNPVVNLVNQTPNILAFTQSPPHITWTFHESEVQNGMWTQNIPTVAQQRGQFQMTATVTTSALTNPSSSPSAPQSGNPSSSAGSNQQQNPPAATGDEQFVLAQGGQNSGGGGGQSRAGGGGCPPGTVFMRGKLSQAGTPPLGYFTDEATGVKILLPRGGNIAPGLKAGDTVGICFKVGVKADSKNSGLTVNGAMYQVSPDDPVWGDGRFIPGPVTKDKDGNYWVEDFRSGLRYQLDKDNCDPDALIARQEKDAAAAKAAKKNPPTFEEKDAAYWKWFRAKTIHDAWEKKKQLFDDWRAAKKEWDAKNPNKVFPEKPPVPPDANEPPKPGEEQLYPGARGTITPPAKADDFPKITCKDVKVGALSYPAEIRELRASKVSLT